MEEDIWICLLLYIFNSPPSLILGSSMHILNINHWIPANSSVLILCSAPLHFSLPHISHNQTIRPRVLCIAFLEFCFGRHYLLPKFTRTVGSLAPPFSYYILSSSFFFFFVFFFWKNYLHTHVDSYFFSPYPLFNPPPPHSHCAN